MKPDFKDGYPFSKKLFAVKLGKTKVKKASIPWTNNIRPKQGANLKVCLHASQVWKVKSYYTDTDRGRRF